MSEFELSELSDEEIESMSVDGLGLYILVHLSKDINTEWNLDTIVSELIYQTEFDDITRRSASAQQAITEAIGGLLNGGFLSRNRPPGLGYSRGADSIFVTRAGERVLNNTELGIRSIIATRLLENLLHLELRDARSRFLDGQYSNAVFEATRSIEIRVRALAAPNDRRASGVPLMRSSFGEIGPLTDPEQDKGWSDGMRDLFAGVFGVYRNDTAHARNEEAYQDPEEVARIILLVDLMHSHLDRIEQRLSTQSN